MTDPIKITLTGSEDFGRAEIEVTGVSPREVAERLNSGDFNSLVAEVIAQQTLLAKGLKASHGLSQEPRQSFNDQVLQAGGPVQQPAQPPAWAQQQPAQQQSGPACKNCNAPLNYSTTKRGGMWKCPNYKGVKANGEWVEGGNGHEMRFVD
jgi:hypothetical protein